MYSGKYVSISTVKISKTENSNMEVSVVNSFRALFVGIMFFIRNSQKWYAGGRAGHYHYPFTH